TRGCDQRHGSPQRSGLHAGRKIFVRQRFRQENDNALRRATGRYPRDRPIVRRYECGQSDRSAGRDESRSKRERLLHWARRILDHVTRRQAPRNGVEHRASSKSGIRRRGQQDSLLDGAYWSLPDSLEDPWNITPGIFLKVLLAMSVWKT